MLAACGARSAPLPVPAASSTVPRLPAPPLIDSSARGAAYLTAVAQSLQPAWHQFLEDCRLRLPARDPLNQPVLAATVELDIGQRGEIVALRMRGSGNRDFDQAIAQVIGDAAPFPPPPRDLWSDDDRAHVVWTFARDHRQAGPATAQIVDHELPLGEVIDKRIAERDLSRAARRLLRARPSPERERATQQLMIATLREALDSSDGVVRRAALDAIARSNVTELAGDVRPLLTATSDSEMRIAAIETSAALRDDKAVEVLVEHLRADLREQPRLALAEARALVAMGHARRVAPLLAGHLDAKRPDATAVSILALAPIRELDHLLPSWLRSGQVSTRAAACSALAGYPDELAWPLIERGLRDRDASVRAACAESAAAPGASGRVASAAPRTALARLRELARDRDSAVRARAVTAIAVLDPARVPDVSGDTAAEVRVAFAAAMAVSPMPDAKMHLRALIDDRDADVRTAAWTALAALPTDAEHDELAARAAADVAPSVRRAAVPLFADEILLRLGNTDEAAEVRNAAIIRFASRRGRTASIDHLLERLAGAAPDGPERVRTAAAWLLAR